MKICIFNVRTQRYCRVLHTATTSLPLILLGPIQPITILEMTSDWVYCFVIIAHMQNQSRSLFLASFSKDSSAGQAHCMTLKEEEFELLVPLRELWRGCPSISAVSLDTPSKPHWSEHMYNVLTSRTDSASQISHNISVNFFRRNLNHPTWVLDTATMLLTRKTSRFVAQFAAWTAVSTRTPIALVALESSDYVASTWSFAASPVLPVFLSDAVDPSSNVMDAQLWMRSANSWTWSCPVRFLATRKCLWQCHFSD